MVSHGRERRIDAAQAGFSEFETKIEIGMRDRRIDFIKSSNGKEILAPHGQTRRGQCRNCPHGLRKIGVIHRIARPLMQGCSHQPAYTGDQAGVLNSTCRVKQFRRNRTDFLVLQWFDDVLNPIALSRFNIIVEKNDTFAARRLRAGVAFCGKVERRIERDEASLTADRFR